MVAGRKLAGIVFSDLGRAASFMTVDRVAAALRDALGFAPYPGTLNLKLNTPESQRTWAAVKNDAAGIEIRALDAAHCSARCFRIQIEGNWPGAVILPAVQGYPADKLEVIAPLRLKDALKVEDGALITLEFVD